jgi:hypothetical protein
MGHQKGRPLLSSRNKFSKQHSYDDKLVGACNVIDEWKAGRIDDKKLILSLVSTFGRQQGRYLADGVFADRV